MESEIRQNKATGQWVIYAPARSRRNHDFTGRPHRKLKRRAGDERCPFCPGNEDRLPPVILALPDRGKWQTRVVPNKFPALAPGTDMRRRMDGIYVKMAGYGRHEVIIETPRHNDDLQDMSQGEIEIVVETYHRRYMDLAKENRNLMIILFRNHGPMAGTSLMHPHSQVIATGVVPQHIRQREREAQEYFDNWGRCVFCDILNHEMQVRRRVLYENECFLAFIPFAAEVPFEIWIMPKKHSPDFGNITDDEKTHLSESLRNLLGRLGKKLNDPDYNYVINTAARYRANAPQLHWYLQIRPRLVTPAGFEIGSGMPINPSLPEADADFLNKADSFKSKK